MKRIPDRVIIFHQCSAVIPVILEMNQKTNEGRSGKCLGKCCFILKGDRRYYAYDLENIL